MDTNAEEISPLVAYPCNFRLILKLFRAAFGVESAVLIVVRMSPGKPYPLGPVFDGFGVNFALFSSVATRVELCLFDDRGEETRCDLPEVTAFCWHGYLPGLQPGQPYGFRVHGPWAPASGIRCNPAKLLLDPYARYIEGRVHWNQAVFGHHWDNPAQRNDLDSARYMPRCVVTTEDFDWGADRPLRTPWDLTTIYEAHVKGLTIRHPDVPADFRGTYLAVAHPAIIRHLKQLGITAIELMPIQQFVHDLHLLQRGVRNYWGYNTIGFFAPHNEYLAGTCAAGRQLWEFKEMVKTLHSAGIEVILDVVYNHTAEGNHLGPVLAFKGIDNATYYRLSETDASYYVDHTGTGNSLNTRQPYALQLLMDSLRYWVTEMHVDGFRFDLASTLARGTDGVDPLSAFFDLIQQDPVVRQVKLIAEPWDLGTGGYQLGRFPALWSEWNGRFRNGVRDYWRGTDHTLNEFAHRISGSRDLYERNGREPTASINFVTCHDGFTLADLVSYELKYNHANGEDNKDGENDNHSWNCGHEGPTDRVEIKELRNRQKRNLLATLFLSHGVPMLLAGDELGRSQAGNNNAYCQDNELSWLDWKHYDAELFNFVARLAALRRQHPIFRRRRFGCVCGERCRDCRGAKWYRNDGESLSPDDWYLAYAKALGLFLSASTSDEDDDDFYIAFNAHFENLNFTLPPELDGQWSVVFNTADPQRPTGQISSNAPVFSVEAHAMLSLRSRRKS